MQLAGELAETTADIGNQTAGTEFAAESKSLRARRATELFPKTKDLSSRKLKAMKSDTRSAQVLHFSGSKRKFRSGRLSPKRAPHLCDNGSIGILTSSGLEHHGAATITPPLPQHEETRLQKKSNILTAARFCWRFVKTIVHRLTHSRLSREG